MADEDLINKIEETTIDAKRHQQQTLATILHINGRVEYLRQFLKITNNHFTVDNFRQLVPLSTYDDYADHINRMAEGISDDDDHDHGRHFLSVDPLLCFFLSSGTSNMKPKLIPYFDSAASKAVSFLAHHGSSAIQRRLFPQRPTVNKSLWFIYAGNVTVTKSGFKAMPASSVPLSGNKETQSQFLSTCIAPAEVVKGSNLQQQMYCHLLCGLSKFEIIDSIRAPYAIGLIKAFSLLHTKWEQLCKDLESGTVTSEITDVAMRDSVNEFLCGPHPEIAQRVSAMCQEKSWDGILAKLWPNARFIRCIMTGSMQQYYPKLKHYAGSLQLLGGEYFTSECCVGINMDILQPPEMTRYVILPTAAYFEFLPFDLDVNNDSIRKETVALPEVEIGKMYEVVVTTYRGLYRYRLGDIIKVVGFHNSSPEVEFVMRAPKDLKEVLTERDLMRAIQNLELAVGSLVTEQIIEFSAFMDLESESKLVKIFVEFACGCALLRQEKKKELILLLESCRSTIEDGLGAFYKLKKESSKIKTLVLSIVKSGTFDLLLQKAIENGAPASQYKPPKIIRSRKIADFMDASSALTVTFN
ncbi:probable indole-3-acetic acid-amido synthetase GH3.6 [Amaranthus tricolor]|uniref:probable indole-3-acetic acid-amido synthetase GH3.6 n=1 Tax=Amaranthus tricolor TaxID=29722 RepID=UPI00258CB0DB|nr:probable indole-3-acetic acid-amido synthetase GH3.6 [Amaranthus tricolor]XP_057535069.1 probable indole-3-acetic acid-amido synthetase GH3.6 [Amaranthus tricolor]